MEPGHQEVQQKEEVEGSPRSTALPIIHAALNAYLARSVVASRQRLHLKDRGIDDQPPREASQCSCCVIQRLGRGFQQRHFLYYYGAYVKENYVILFTPPADNKNCNPPTPFIRPFLYTVAISMQSLVEEESLHRNHCVALSIDASEALYRALYRTAEATAWGLIRNEHLESTSRSYISRESDVHVSMMHALYMEESVPHWRHHNAVLLSQRAARGFLWRMQVALFRTGVSLCRESMSVSMVDFVDGVKQLRAEHEEWLRRHAATKLLQDVGRGHSLRRSLSLPLATDPTTCELAEYSHREWLELYWAEGVDYLACETRKLQVERRMGHVVHVTHVEECGSYLSLCLAILPQLQTELRRWYQIQAFSAGLREYEAYHRVLLQRQEERDRGAHIINYELLVAMDKLRVQHNSYMCNVYHAMHEERTLLWCSARLIRRHQILMVKLGEEERNLRDEMVVTWRDAAPAQRRRKFYANAFGSTIFNASLRSNHEPLTRMGSTLARVQSTVRRASVASVHSLAVSIPSSPRSPTNPTKRPITQSSKDKGAKGGGNYNRPETFSSQSCRNWFTMCYDIPSTLTQRLQTPLKTIEDSMTQGREGASEVFYAGGRRPLLVPAMSPRSAAALPALRR